jgi:hypothetical protein
MSVLHVRTCVQTTRVRMYKQTLVERRLLPRVLYRRNWAVAARRHPGSHVAGNPCMLKGVDT